MKKLGFAITPILVFILFSSSCMGPAVRTPAVGTPAVGTPAVKTGEAPAPAETAVVETPTAPAPNPAAQPREWVAPAVDMNPPPAARWTNGWKKGRPLPAPLAGLRSVTVGKRVYVIGGITGKDALGVRDVLVTTVEKGGKMSPWRKLAPLPAPVAFGSAVLAAGRIYYLGGSSRDGMQNIYDTAWSAKVKKDGSLEAWRTEATLPTRLMNHSAAELGGTIYILGGFNGQDYTASLFMASIGPDGRLGEWRTSPNRYIHRVGRAGLAAVSGSLVAMGGVWSDSQGIHSSSLVMRGTPGPDGDIADWIDEGFKVFSYPLRFSLGEQAVAADAHFIYMFGGSNSDSSGVPTVAAGWLNPRTEKLTRWQAGPDLPLWQKVGPALKARVFNCAAAVVGDAAVVMGGFIFVREPVSTTWVMPLGAYEEPAWLRKRSERR